MISYRIEHRTTYSYDADVTGSYGLFHLRPRDLAWQSCLAHEIAIDPEPADLFRHIDLYGNTKAYFHVIKPHTRLVVTSTSMVDIGVNELDPEALAVPWEWAQPRLRDDDGKRGKPWISRSLRPMSKCLPRSRTMLGSPSWPGARLARPRSS